MNPFVRFLVWMGATSAAFGAGWLWLLQLLDAKQAAAFLGALGLLFTISNALLALLFRQYNEAPPKDLAPHRKERMKRVYGKRLNLVWSRYYRSLSASIVAILSAWALNNKIEIFSERILGGVGCAALFHGISLASLALHEVRHSAAVSRQLADELDRRKRRNLALAALEQTPRGTESSKG